MKLYTVLAAGSMLAGVALSSAPASASICPANINAACDLVITLNADGSIATTGTGGSSIGGEDALIGVVNDTTGALTSFSLTGSGIYGFDGDGIDTYTGIGPVAGNPDTTTYGGPDGYFTNINGDTGTVNFVGGIAPGGTDYFSLEEAVSLTAPPTATAPVTTTTTVPEPSSLIILLSALLGLTLLRRKSVGQI